MIDIDRIQVEEKFPEEIILTLLTKGAITQSFVMEKKVVEQMMNELKVILEAKK